jgi:dynein heavy chain
VKPLEHPQVDKEWTSRMMAKAKDVRNVVECCQNEYIKAMLPSMIFDLEKCQKALDGYLEAKRNKFPRFYFVSNPALLLILSQGSDKVDTPPQHPCNILVTPL